ncbi:MAG: hypothetical protein KDC92_14175, partial [Bacteroidetes bacterium]|nr:hypothetical protein [Bacteroidota bacterium]
MKLLFSLLLLSICVNLNAQWIKLKHNCPDSNFTEVQFADRATGYLVAEKNRLYKTLDSGKTWTQLTLPENSQVVKLFHFSSNGTGFIGAGPWTPVAAEVFKTTDGGQSWQSVFNPENFQRDNFITGIDILSDSVLFVNSFDSLRKSSDGGETWVTIGKTLGRKIYFANENIGISTKNRDIFSTSDGGKTFSPPFQMASNYQIMDLSFANEEFAIAVASFSIPGGNSSVIYKTNDGGVTWDLSQLISSEYFDELCLVNKEVSFMYASYGYEKLYYTKNAGKFWETYNEFEGKISSIDFVDSQHGWAVGTHIYKTKNAAGLIKNSVSNPIEKSLCFYPNPANNHINLEF